MKSLPKVLLHDHLDGGLRPETIIEIADEIGYTNLPTNKPTELADWYQEACDSGSLVRYLETFDHTIAVMQREQDMIRVAKEAVIDLANDGVIYAEIRVAPSRVHAQSPPFWLLASRCSRCQPLESLLCRDGHVVLDQ